MALFRKKQKEVVPAELEAFYEQEPTWKRVGRRILAILIVVAILALLVWAAIRVYEQVTNRDVDMPGQDTTDIAEQPAEQNPTDEQSAPTNQGEGSTNQETALPGAESDQSDEGVVDDGAVATTNPEAAMPSTGPADVLWVVLGVAAVSTLIYQLKLRRQN